MSLSVISELNDSVAFIAAQMPYKPRIAVILGSGLGNFIDEMIIDVSIPYISIPHFPVSTVEGHSGKLIFGKLGNKEVMVMAGRFHYYEGYTPQQVCYPVRVMKMLGAEVLLLSNAAGGVGEGFQVGDMMIIEDHISFFTENPLIGKNENTLGSRFPDMSAPYNKQLIDLANSIALNLGFTLKRGVYVGVTGPTFETHAEYRLIKAVGGHAVGMSTVQEVIAAVHCGMQVFGMSVITDLGIRADNNIITHEEVLQAAKDAEPKLSLLFREMVKEI